MILIDDHPIVREGICALLTLESDMTIVGDAGDMDTGIELVRRHKPDLVICDLTMPGCTGTIAVRKLCRQCPNARVLVLSAHDSLGFIRESFAAGAIGYVRKDALRADLLTVVRRAATGAQAICLGVSEMLMRNWLLNAGTAAGPCQCDARSRGPANPAAPCPRGAELAHCGRSAPRGQGGRKISRQSDAPSEFVQHCRRCTLCGDL